MKLTENAGDSPIFDHDRHRSGKQHLKRDKIQKYKQKVAQTDKKCKFSTNRSQNKGINAALKQTTRSQTQRLQYWHLKVKTISKVKHKVNLSLAIV